MRQWTRFEPRDLAFCSVFGAAALLLPVIFHALQLGKIFLPMYLPLFALAFVVRPYPCGLTAALVPLLSAALTGMPPLYPPVAWIMSAELGLSASAVAWAADRFLNCSPVLYLLPVLVLGRAFNAALNYLVAGWMHLPGGFLAGTTFLSAWPGILLILLTIPAFARLLQDFRPARTAGPEGEDSP